MLKYKVRFVEPFKDGQVFGSKLYKAGEIDIIDAGLVERARSSGAILDVLETLIPNPLKNLPHEPEQVIVTGTLNDDSVNQNIIAPLEEPKPIKKGKKNAKG